MVDEEAILLELVVVDERVGDAELDVFIIRLGKSMLLEILEETRLDVVTRLEDDLGVEVVVALELIKVVLLELVEDFELVKAFRMLDVAFDKLDDLELECVNLELVNAALEVLEDEL